MIGTMTMPESTKLFIQFKSDGKVSGHGGCNRFFGAYRIFENKIEMGPLASTRMACEQPIMDMEQVFLSAFDGVGIFKRNRTKLELFDADGKPKINFIQTDWD